MVRDINEKKAKEFEKKLEEESHENKSLENKSLENKSLENKNHEEAMNYYKKIWGIKDIDEGIFSKDIEESAPSTQETKTQ
jgi:hypothetical protein